MGTGEQTRRVYFAHQSVGAAVLDAIPAAATERGIPAPAIHLVSDLDAPERGDVILHGPLGHNGDPLGKIAAFDTQVRGALGERVDVALMKLCYADVTSETDVDEVLDAYTSTLAGLERDLPHVRFLPATVPLTTRPGVRTRIKMALGRDPHLGPADNAARERFNTGVREAYAGERLYDIAAVESTTPTGGRASGRHRGRAYHRLWGGYAADPGHLNGPGSRAAAAALLDATVLVHEDAS